MQAPRRRRKGWLAGVEGSGGREGVRSRWNQNTIRGRIRCNEQDGRGKEARRVWHDHKPEGAARSDESGASGESAINNLPRHGHAAAAAAVAAVAAAAARRRSSHCLPRAVIGRARRYA